MEPQYITKEEHREFALRIDDENKRQNHRIQLLEGSMERMAALTSSVEKLALNMESMLKEQEKQGKRLETLEGRDGEMWRKVASYLVTLAAGTLAGFAFRQIGM